MHCAAEWQRRKKGTGLLRKDRLKAGQDPGTIIHWQPRDEYLPPQAQGRGRDGVDERPPWPLGSSGGWGPPAAASLPWRPPLPTSPASSGSTSAAWLTEWRG